jgi:hypothetical protein
LLDVRYGSPRVFPVLATLYPGLDMTKAFHEDHIFPRSRFTRTKLLKEGIPVEQVEDYLAKVDGLPNLQLLPGIPNIEKQATLPADWLDGPFFPKDPPDRQKSAAREQYVRDNDLQEVPAGLIGFLDFYSARRKRLETRLKAALGVG